MRYSTKRPPPSGKQQRALLRPVYWLGNWQFACLGYYEPPRRTHDVAVAAEPFPPVLARLVAQIEKRVRRDFPPQFVPRKWHLNTCLVNFYGSRIVDGKTVDAARVGEHRDFEPGPVASLSLGERARFQFVRRGATENAPPVRTEWLDDGSLQIFAGPRWKDDLLHRVQRVENKHDVELPPAIAAPAYGQGTYRQEHLDQIIATAFTGFAAAVAESERLWPGTPVTVCTGFWGCGAFGGNRTVMTALQLVAAKMAGVARVRFFTVRPEGLGDFERGAAASVADLVHERWGTSDGN